MRPGPPRRSAPREGGRTYVLEQRAAAVTRHAGQGIDGERGLGLLLQLVGERCTQIRHERVVDRREWLDPASIATIAAIWTMMEAVQADTGVPTLGIAAMIHERSEDC